MTNTPSYTLGDGEARHLANPTTFARPSKEELAAVGPGVLVKLMFESEELGGERMWVLVTEKFDDGEYFGVLQNWPVVFEDIEYGEPLDFTEKNIIDVTI